MIAFMDWCINTLLDNVPGTTQRPDYYVYLLYFLFPFYLDTGFEFFEQRYGFVYLVLDLS